MVPKTSRQPAKTPMPLPQGRHAMSDPRRFQSVPEWANPSVFGVNRLPAHTRWGAYDSEERARAAVHGSSPFL